MSAERPRTLVLSSTLAGRLLVERAVLPCESVELAGIITTGPEIEISYAAEPVQLVTHAVFEDIAERAHCPCIVFRGRVTSRTYVDAFTDLKPDLVLALGWYYMVPRTVRDMVPLGCLGVHASLLPKYRGGAPVPWAIINGETETGVTLFYLDEGVDTGEIVSQARVRIATNDTSATVYEKVVDRGAELLTTMIPRVVIGTAPRIRQDETQATLFPQRSPDDGEIRWDARGARQVHNWIRALTRPYPGAFTYLHSERVIVWRAAPLDRQPTRSPPGTIQLDPPDAPHAIAVSCADGGWVRVEEMQVENEEPMRAREFAEKRGVTTGSYFSVRGTSGSSAA